MGNEIWGRNFSSKNISSIQKIATTIIIPKLFFFDWCLFLVLEHRNKLGIKSLIQMQMIELFSCYKLNLIQMSQFLLELLLSVIFTRVDIIFRFKISYSRCHSLFVHNRIFFFSNLFLFSFYLFIFSISFIRSNTTTY